MSTRYIAPTTPTLAITFITTVVVTIAGFALGLTEEWVMPSLQSAVRLACASVLVIIGYYAMIECWRGTEISVIVPFRYSVVLWAVLFGYVFLGEVPDLWTLGGASIVVFAGLYTFHREQVRRQG